MNEPIKKRRIYKENQKLRQVTHWDVDYLSREQLDAYYQTPPEPRAPERQPSGRNPTTPILPFVLMGAGVALLLLALGLGFLL